MIPQSLVHCGVSEATILNRYKAYTALVLNFDFRSAVLGIFFVF
jgi:hypothetical protein